ncbi:MAG: transcriptional repressor LexA [Polyangia bacterium]
MARFDESHSSLRSVPTASSAGPSSGSSPGSGDRSRPEHEPLDDQIEHGLTKRQRAVLDYIWRTIRENGYPPTLREIGEELGIRSTNGVNDHLKALERKGYLIREDLKSRALRVLHYFDEDDRLCKASEVPARSLRTSATTTTPWQRARTSAVTHELAGDSMGESLGELTREPADFIDVPVLGKVAAGQPILALEQREDTVRVDRFFLGQNRDVFALRVRGDSMIEAGIFDGDYIFVRKQPTARTGDIVVAMINDEATVKYFHPAEDRIVFKPANSRLRPIEVRRTDWKPVNLLGTVVGVYRRMQ